MIHHDGLQFGDRGLGVAGLREKLSAQLPLVQPGRRCLVGEQRGQELRHLVGLLLDLILQRRDLVLQAVDQRLQRDGPIADDDRRRRDGDRAERPLDRAVNRLHAQRQCG